MRKIFLSVLMIMILITVISNLHAQTSQETITQYISDLQKNPNDYALREKIIRHVQTMKPAPAIPEEAERYMVRGRTAFKGAKEARDFNDAAHEFKQALLYAPWLAEGYYNLGIIQDKAGLYADAIKSLKFYLIAAPTAPDAQKVKELVYEIEYRQEKAAKESSPAAIAAKKEKEYEDWLRKIDGRRYVHRDPDTRITNILDIKGRTLICGYIIEPGSPASGPRDIYMETERYEIYGRVVEGPVVSSQEISTQVIFTISENGEKIHQEFWLGSRGKGRKGREYDFFWKR
jgi:tetratricopeptide (TPR) repeat protein